jgi:predicted alpha/beta-fold hydrolase
LSKDRQAGFFIDKVKNRKYKKHEILVFTFKMSFFMATELKPTFHPPWFLFNAHLETIFPAIFRRININPSGRKRISTPDLDFIDIDYYHTGTKKTVILCHGLEGSSQKPYIKGMVKVLVDRGFNCIAMNFRGCSGTANNHPYSYHSGATSDLELVVQTTREIFHNTEISLLGFSLGGNLILKYLGERPDTSFIKKAVAISTPLDLLNSCRKISKPSNRIYTIRFLYYLKKKIKNKAKIFPDKIPLDSLRDIKNLEEFDDKYTAPLHGFKNAMHYYNSCSSIHFIKNISVPTLLINARNDPFLSAGCYPVGINDTHITYDYPVHGGHLGFKLSKPSNGYYHEIKCADFLAR